jgi:hypothetical protein
MPGTTGTSVQSTSRSTNARGLSGRLSFLSLGLCLVAAPTSLSSQAITIDTRTGTQVHSTDAPVDRRFAQIEPTHVQLSKVSLNTKSKLELIRVLQSEQGFAMRPFPRGHKGLTLVANGKLEPAGEDYLNMVTTDGLSAKPGDRLVLTDVKIEHNRIVFQLNGGPDLKHRFLRHIEIGSGPMMSPVVQDSNDNGPMGARLTLEFKGGIPNVTGTEVKALLAPLISFDVKTPVQAFTDTLPPMLKNAILDHHVLVGMTTDMVLFAKGEPDNKMREIEGQMPFEEWIYGKPPKDVEFVRINGNRVIRVEIAKIGAPVQVFDKDVVEGMMRTDGTPLTPGTPGVHTVEMGDVHRDPDTQAPAPPPSLRQDGEALPGDSKRDNDPYAMKPVQFPAQKPDDQPGYGAPPPSQQTPTQPPGSAAPSASGTASPSTTNSSATPPAQPAAEKQPANPAQPTQPQ